MEELCSALETALTNGTITPFKIAIQKGLLANGSDIDAFIKESSSTLREDCTKLMGETLVPVMLLPQSS
jgi:hypothetical protein